MKRMMLLCMLAVMLVGCVATAPISVAWRSNSHQQYATTEGKTNTQAGGDTVNAEKTTTTEAAVTANSAGNADTGGSAKKATKSQEDVKKDNAENTSP